MIFRTLIAFAVLLGQSACDIHVGGNSPPQAISDYRRCSDVVRPKQADVAIRLEELLGKNEYACAERLLREALFLERDARVISLLEGLLAPSKSSSPVAATSMPNTTKIVALHYLSSMSPPSKTRDTILNDYGDFVRAEARTATDESRVDAYSVLFNIAKEDDIPLFVDGIKTGGESIVSIGTSALANSCSPRAVAALKETMKHQAVVAYLQKYRDKETITRTLRQDCPAAL